MNRLTKPLRRLSVLAMLAIFAATPAYADKPSWAGGGHGDDRHEKHHHEHGHDRGDHDGDRHHREGGRFDDSQRHIVYEYYGAQFHSGHCPPGLAKKHNGCMPPGRARKWSRGRPLPQEIVRYPLPPELVVRLPAPSVGQEYVRVASDILLIAVGTGMVIDAIQDIGR